MVPLLGLFVRRRRLSCSAWVIGVCSGPGRAGGSADNGGLVRGRHPALFQGRERWAGDTSFIRIDETFILIDWILAADRFPIRKVYQKKQLKDYNNVDTKI
jgi:hypothetical protein